jgi:hypothetical protein
MIAQDGANLVAEHQLAVSEKPTPSFTACSLCSESLQGPPSRGSIELAKMCFLTGLVPYSLIR